MHEVVLLLMLAGQSQTASTTSTAGAEMAPAAFCEPARIALATATHGAAEEICLGEQQRRIGDGLSSDARSGAYREAATHLRRAANLLPDPEWKSRVLDALATLHDAKHLDEPGVEEAILRELMATRPDDLAPHFRLAQLQEQVGFIESAEDTLIGVRRRYPQSIETYHRLAQFYARQAGAISQQARLAKAAATPATPAGEPDGQGVYKVGDAITQPRREGTPRYPAEALQAGIEGVVICEIVVDAEGRVAEAAVVRSIPLLDDAALAAVRTWRYEPTVVNGQAVPVRMMVTVNFTRR